MSKSNKKSGIDRLAATLAVDADVTEVNQVSATRARGLAKLGVETVRDLENHFPRRYIDMSQVKTVAQAQIGDECTISGTVYETKMKQPNRRLRIEETTIVDATGTLIVSTFGSKWMRPTCEAGMKVAVSGKLEFNYGFKRMTNPTITVLEDDGGDVHGLILPVHAANSDVPQGMVRRLVANALELTRGQLDPVPLGLRMKYRLMSKEQALRCIHFPRTMEEQRQARRRLAYEELLLLELVMMQEGERDEKGTEATAHVVDGRHMQALGSAVPFNLTGEQENARDEILKLMAAPKPMNHLLLGDVGTGKTIVAAFSLAAVSDSSTQAALMAPTEILAQQHAASLGTILDEAGITWELLTGSTSASNREAVLKRVAAGTVDVLIGTHALIEPDVTFANLSLVVIDEQQRFGVDQRMRLLEKGNCPDALFLTATPIPRSLALALFGNLTLSYLHERPRATTPRKTVVCDRVTKGKAYDAALAALKRGEQVYVVCPLIGEKREDDQVEEGKEDTREEKRGKAKEGSKASSADEYEYSAIAIESEFDMEGKNWSAAESHAEFLQNKVFVDFNVGVVHGKLSADKKQEVMDAFRAGDVRVLVATTVIEVGVDVPQATVMIVEDADRFGLAQLHQLRGRVGRGSLPAEVYLISGSRAPVALERLAAMERTDDGFELATFDLSLRREGDILGNRQHGASVLKLVNVVRDGGIVEAAHADARAILDADPHLELEQNKPLAREARMAFKRAEAVVGG